MKFFIFLTFQVMLLQAQTAIPFKKEKKWGLVSKDKKIIVPCIYDGWGMNTSEYTFWKADQTIFFDYNGVKIDKNAQKLKLGLNPKDSLLTLSNGNFAFRKNYDWGIMDKNGKILLEPKYGEYTFLYESKDYVEIYGDYNYLFDKQGNKKLGPANIFEISAGVYFFELNENDQKVYGFFNKDGIILKEKSTILNRISNYDYLNQFYLPYVVKDGKLVRLNYSKIIQSKYGKYLIVNALNNTDMPDHIKLRLATLDGVEKIKPQYDRIIEGNQLIFCIQDSTMDVYKNFVRIDQLKLPVDYELNETVNAEVFTQRKIRAFDIVNDVILFADGQNITYDATGKKVFLDYKIDFEQSFRSDLMIFKHPKFVEFRDKAGTKILQSSELPEPINSDFNGYAKKTNQFYIIYKNFEEIIGCISLDGKVKYWDMPTK